MFYIYVFNNSKVTLRFMSQSHICPICFLQYSQLNKDLIKIQNNLFRITNDPLIKNLVFRH